MADAPPSAKRVAAAETPPPNAQREPAAANASAQNAPAQDAARAAAEAAAQAAIDAAKEAAAQADKDARTQRADQTATANAANDDPRTQAEHDYDAIYGQEQEYDPIADPTLPPPAVQAQGYDPWEKFNRRMHRFNNAVDRRIAKPLALTYIKVVPRPVRLGVGNFFNNLGQPVSAVNALLQGKPKQAGNNVGRFLVNSTVGVAGIFDVASKAKIPNRSEDFGQTLGVWGWKKSRFVELPLFGPRTVRDIVGMAGDSPLSPLRSLNDDAARVFLQGLQLVDVRTQLLPTDSLREGAADEYSLVRDAWLQRRQYQIFGDRKNQSDQTLPDYLQNDDDNPTVPADAMPALRRIP